MNYVLAVYLTLMVLAIVAGFVWLAIEYYRSGR